MGILTISDLILLSQTLVISITLIILIWQLREFIHINRTTLINNIFDKEFNVRNIYISNPEFTNVFTKSKGIDSVLSEDFGVQAYLALRQMLNVYEIAYLERKHLEKVGLWESWDRNSKVTLGNDKFKTIWSFMRKQRTHHKDFIKYIDNILDSAE